MKPSSLAPDIRAILTEARNKTAQAVNSAMVEAYWQVGKRIVEEEQGGESKAAYGEGLLKSLSRELTAEFGKGFSLANLKNFRKFYLTYPEGGKSYTLCSFLSWSHLCSDVSAKSVEMWHGLPAHEYSRMDISFVRVAHSAICESIKQWLFHPIERKSSAGSQCHDFLRSHLLKGNKQLFASKYRTILPTEAELVAELERECLMIEQRKD